MKAHPSFSLALKELRTAPAERGERDTDERELLLSERERGGGGEGGGRELPVRLWV